ncbi:hypothetical protein EXU57_24345 [Segetibacter sp. 3557_3]|uniref:hypothetical protein n=1 Tax=Segetibacter sp. 3557_3 TaxID=2547429 RepID=UPI0010590ACD|nr:hypothetical protein [Segetibacter sp. 3557_3]TDH18182.1 hypothetical protein EXU57_24345 [Segetibacter sp. 3557_3]
MANKGIRSGCARIINTIVLIYCLFFAVTVFYSNATKVPRNVIPLNVPDHLAQETIGLTNVNKRTDHRIIKDDKYEVNIKQRILGAKQKLELLRLIKEGFEKEYTPGSHIMVWVEKGDREASIFGNEIAKFLQSQKLNVNSHVFKAHDLESGLGVGRMDRQVCVVVGMGR